MEIKRKEIKQKLDKESARYIRDISIELHDMIMEEDEIDVEKMLISLEEIGLMATSIIGDYDEREFREMVSEILKKYTIKERERECNTIN